MLTDTLEDTLIDTGGALTAEEWAEELEDEARWKRNDPLEIAAHNAREVANQHHPERWLDMADADNLRWFEQQAAWALMFPAEAADRDRRAAEAEALALAAEEAFAMARDYRAEKIAVALERIDAFDDSKRRSLYVDAGALLSGNLEPVLPTIGKRSDGSPFLYEAKVNVLFGEPESGKTLVAAALAADILFDGGTVLWVDADYNGAAATLLRLQSFGVSPAVLSDFSRFRLVLPEDKESVLDVVKDASNWSPRLAVVDSIGEILSLFGANPNADEDYAPVHRSTLAALAATGASVVAIDHEAKGAVSKAYGSGGAVAKKRAVDGVMLRVQRRSPFKPGEGGKADLTIVKDRHGGVRATSPTSEKEALAATFELSGGDATNWKFWTSPGSTPRAASATQGTDLEILRALTPPPKSAYDVRRRLNWGAERGRAAFDKFAAGVE